MHQDGVRTLSAAADDDAILAPCRVQLEHRRRRSISAGCRERLEKGLHQPLLIHLRVKERRGDKKVAFLGVDAQLIRECVVPVRFHRIPVLHDAAGDGLRVAHASEAAGGQHAAWLLLAGEARLYESASIVDYDARHRAVRRARWHAAAARRLRDCEAGTTRAARAPRGKSGAGPHSPHAS